MTVTPIEKFQSLLRELFQFDCADLDFGIYRIMNHKRDVVEKWVTETLPARVEAELRTGALRADSTTADRLDELKGQLAINFGDDALDGDGNLSPTFHATPLGRQYLELRKAAEHAIGGGDQRAIVFNHLYQFFGHYYDAGDFLSLRRYSARQKYAIPYNGEEVHLHWANADQYYIKTSEYFTDYRWKVPGTMGDMGFSVLFKLRNAEQETGNNKSNEKRYFVFQTSQIVSECGDMSPLFTGRPECGDMSPLFTGRHVGQSESADMSAHSLIIPVQYRALTAAEAKLYAGNGDKPQQLLNEAALAAIRNHELLAKNPSLKAAVLAPARNAAGQPMVDSQSKEPVPLLLKHLRTYARRNNSDFFIHKDLAGFLTRELDFYLKNEVLSLDTLLAGGPRPSEGWFQLLHVIKTIGSDIIAFLAQLENFQKALFEKRKFVTECHWCLTLDRVAASLLPEVVANSQQWKQWEELHKISAIEPKTKSWAKGKDPEKALSWLNTMPFLMVDTSLFQHSDFQDRLLTTLPDIDEQMDGLLVNSENFQGLRLLQERYQESVKCIYIDPPYNTGGDGFIYKDNYQHASWLAMLTDRILLGAGLLSSSGNLLVSCDDNEQHRLRLALDLKHAASSFRSNLVWKSRQNVDSRAIDNISNDHEFVLSYGNAFRGADKDLNKYSNPDGDTRGDWMSDNMVGLATRDARPNLHYHIAVTSKANFRKFAKARGIALNLLDSEAAAPLAPLDAAQLVFLCVSCEKDKLLSMGIVPEPLDKRAVEEGVYECSENGWRYDPRSMAAKITENRVLWPTSPEGRPRKKTFFNELKSDFTGFSSVVGFTRDGTSDLNACFGFTPVSFPKPVKLIEKLTIQCTNSESLILDFFGGSGTTGHAVINLNRDNTSNRKYILMEIGGHFETAAVFFPLKC